METKNWYESKTLWVNVLSLLAMVVASVAGWDEVKDYAPDMLAAVNLINIVLRMLTTTGIK